MKSKFPGQFQQNQKTNRMYVGVCVMSTVPIKLLCKDYEIKEVDLLICLSFELDFNESKIF